MRPISLTNLEPRYKRSRKPSIDRYTKSYGFDNTNYIQTQSLTPRYKRIEKRNISTNPYKILDAPNIFADYYLNILDWNKNNIVSIGLGDELYLYDVLKKDVINLQSFGENNYICSIKSQENLLACGISTGNIYIFDIQKKKILNILKENETRVACLDFNENILTSGSRNGKIINFDLRDNKIVNEWKRHSQEVCGLKWSPNKKFLASGGNDNMLYIWQLGNNSPRYIFNEHSSAVKALDWCPWKSSILASGGGSNDKSIRFWDITTGNCERNFTVTSQVCNIHFLTKYKEIITTHGFSENNINLYKESNFNLISSFGKHDNRVLYSALSPDQSSLISLAGDENLKFWKINEQIENKKIIDSDQMIFR